MQFLIGLFLGFAAPLQDFSGPSAGPDGLAGSGLFGFDWGEVIATVLGLVGTATAGWWAWRKTQAQSKDAQQLRFYEQLMTECNQLRQQNAEFRGELATMRAEQESIKERLRFYESNTVALQARALFEAAMDHDPRPQWLHHVGMNRWYINDAYADRFKIQRQSFWTPVHILARYTPADLLVYINRDLEVIAAGVPLEFSEPVKDRVMDPTCETWVTWLVRKAPIVVGEDRYVIGTMLQELAHNDTSLIEQGGENV